MPIRTACGVFNVRFTVQAAVQVHHRTVKVAGDDLDTASLRAIIRTLAADQGTPEPDIHLIAAERLSGVLELFDSDDDEPAAQTGTPSRPQTAKAGKPK